MTSEQLPFIGRQEQLTLVDHLLAGEGTRAALCVGGPGGIGKTRLLQEIKRRYAPDGPVLLVGILDFDLPSLHVVGALELEIAQQFATAGFDEYLRKLRDVQMLRQAPGISFELIAQEARAAGAAFQACYRHLSERRRILVLLDTVERAYDSDIWPDIVRVIAESTNTLWVLSGRAAQKTCQSLAERLGADAVELAELGPLPASDASSYLGAKERQLGIGIEPDLRTQLITATGGLAILLDLAVEWVAREIPLAWLTEQPPRDLADLSATERAELEAALVWPCEELPGGLNQIVMNLAHVYPMDDALLAALHRLGRAQTGAAMDSLRRMAFVKALPDDSLTLHDEMRRMVNEHIWPVLDPDGDRRRRISAQSAQHLGRQAFALRDQPTSTRDAIPLAVFLEQHAARQRYWRVRELQLHHTLAADPSAGYALFRELFDEATHTYQFAVRGALLDQIEPFANRLGHDAHYIIATSRARYLLDSGRAADVSRADALLTALIEHYAGDSEREVDLLTRLADCAVKSGQAPRAAAYLERAVTIARGRHQRDGLSAVLNFLGRVYRMLERLDDARSTYHAALDYASDDRTIASIYNNLGYVECLLGEGTAGLGYCESGLEIREQLGLLRETGMSHTTIADACRYLGRNEQALEHLDQALRIFAPTDREWLARVYTRRGAVLRIMAKDDAGFQSAIADLRRALSQEVVVETPYAQHVLGCVYWNLGNLDRALELFAESYRLAEEIADVRSIINNIVARAEVYLELWQRSRDPRYSELVLASGAELDRLLAQGYQLFHHRGRMYRVLGDLAYAQGQFDTACARYAQAYSLLGGRYAGYGRRTFEDELRHLESQIEALPPAEALAWCDALTEFWSDASREIYQYGALLSMVRRMRISARFRARTAGGA